MVTSETGAPSTSVSKAEGSSKAGSGFAVQAATSIVAADSKKCRILSVFNNLQQLLVFLDTLPGSLLVGFSEFGILVIEFVLHFLDN